MGLCKLQWAIISVKSLGSHRRSLSCNRVGRLGGSFCWRVNGELGSICMETFCTMICSVGVWIFLSKCVGESGTVTMDCLRGVHSR